MSGRLATWLAAAGCALSLAGCGGGSEATPSEPAIPAPIAEDLAARSEEIAATLDGGDVCGAAQQADDLVRAADEAIQDGQIPQALQGELQNVALELQNTINCPEPERDEEDEDDDKGKGKGNGKDKKGEEEVTTTATTTESSG